MTYFQNSRLVIDTGSALPYPLRDKINEIISQFVVDRDVQKAAKEIADFTQEIHDEFTMTWTIS